MAFHPYFKTRDSASSAWQVPDLYAAYGGPSGLSGRGKIGLIEMGGQYSASDMTQFCQLVGMPEPNVSNPSGPFQSDPNGADVEVNLDAQIAACVYWKATGQPASLEFIWESSDQAAAVTTAKNAGCATFGCSWGEDESDYGATALQAMDAACASAFPMLVFAAAGDNDSSDGVPGQAANVDGPASCPHVVACGGTSKPKTGAETVWNNNPGNTDGEGTGGGYSTVFPPQSWQTGAPPAPDGRGRMVPDVAACADPDTGYVIVSGGQQQVVGGTSCVAPFYAGFFAALPEPSAPLGPTLWENPSDFNGTIDGNNGAYSQPPCPGPCTGLGSPKLTDLTATFGASQPTPTPAPLPTPAPTPTPTPQPVDSIRAATATLQQALLAAGYSSVRVTGTMDVHTFVDAVLYDRANPAS